MENKKKETGKAQSNSRSFIEEVNLPKVKKKSFILLYVAIFAFAVYAVITLVNQYIEISDKIKLRDELNYQISVQEIKNEDIKKVINYSGEELDEYIEKIAREELEYIGQGERVFINISGD